MPPASMLGHFSTVGDGDAVARWLLDLDTTGLSAVVVSADMLAYGGLVGSRTATTPLSTARARIAALMRFHQAHPAVPLYVFATIMRLAPTETPRTEPYLEPLTDYARNAGVPAASATQKDALAAWRAQIPDDAFWDYIGARARDLDIDQMLVRMASSGDLTWLAITQDDAGAPDGVQISDQRALSTEIEALNTSERVIVAPGADEMGMVTTTRAIEDATGWHPAIALAYSDDRGPTAQDPLEDVTVSHTVSDIVRELGASQTTGTPSYVLDILAPATPRQARDRFIAQIADQLRAGTPTAIADLSFIDDDVAEERAGFEALQTSGTAALPAAFASWNSTANTVGTAMSAATCAVMASHRGLDTSAARENFLFDRYVDDYAYRLLVRPPLNATLRGEGIDTYALGAHAADAESRMRAMLWPLAVDLFDADFAGNGWAQNGLSMYYPWQRTFEIRLETTLRRDRLRE